MSCDGTGIIEHVKRQAGNCKTQEAVSLEHLEKDENEEHVDDIFRYSEPWDLLGIDVVLHGVLIDEVIKLLSGNLFLLLVFVITLFLILFIFQRLSADGI